MKKKDKWEKIDNGLVLMFLIEHLPTMQVQLKEGSKSFKIKWKALLNLMMLIDSKMMDSLNEDSMEFILSQKEKRKDYVYNKSFLRYLNYNFYEGMYDKNNGLARTYLLRDSFSQIIMYYLKEVIKENKFDLLFDVYKINTLDIKFGKYVNNVKFKNFIYIDEEDFKYEDTINKNPIIMSNMNPTNLLKDKNLFKQIYNNANVKISKKSFAEKYYGFTKREKDELEYSEQYNYTFYIEKEKRFKVDKNNKNSILSKYKFYTKVEIDENNLKDYIIESVNKGVNIGNIFKILHLIRYYKDNDNYILYEISNFRVFSKSEINKGFNFQMVSSKLRKIIFQGNYDYDIQAGAPTLLYQYLEKYLKKK